MDIHRQETDQQSISDSEDQAPALAPSPRSYQHSPIKWPGTIRLIKLQPSSVLEAEIQCQLIKETLDDCVNGFTLHYVALSYVWGDATERRQINIGSETLEVTASLECALRHLRHQSRVLHIWADGVCIDQNCVDDRNIQVSQMGAVYSTAKQTMIFLGPMNDERDHLMNFMLSKQWPAVGSGIETLAQYRELMQRQLLSAPWFTRVWVLQELILSADPWVQVGTQTIRWGDFCAHIDRWGSRSSDHFTEMKILKKKYKPPSERGHMFISENIEMINSTGWLVEILHRRRGAGVLDPRDMIYAHLSLCSTTLKAQVTVDYVQSFLELYEDVARNHVQCRGTLEILSFVQLEQPDERRPFLPSWVPDWTAPKAASRASLPHTNQRQERLGPILFDIPHTMRVAGLHLGTIKCLVPYAPQREFVRNTNGRHPTHAVLTKLAAAQNDAAQGLCPELTDSGILSWVSNPESQVVFEAIAATYASICTPLIPTKQSLSTRARYYDDYVREEWLKYKTSKDLMGFSKIVHRILPSLLPSPLGKVIHESTMLEIDLTHILRNMLVSLCECAGTGKLGAILSTGIVVQVEPAARLGDIVASFEAYPDTTFIFRPETESSMQRDRVGRSLAEKRHLANEFCKFVTYGPKHEGSRTGLEGYDGRERRHYVTFAIV